MTPYWGRTGDHRAPRATKQSRAESNPMVRWAKIEKAYGLANRSSQWGARGFRFPESVTESRTALQIDEIER